MVCALWVGFAVTRALYTDALVQESQKRQRLIEEGLIAALLNGQPSNVQHAIAAAGAPPRVTATPIENRAALTAASAGVSMRNQQQQNRSARRAGDAAAEAASVQSKQIKNQATVEKAKLRNQAEMIRGRIRAAAASSGFVNDGTFQTLDEQVTTDTNLNTQIINQNVRNNIARVQSGLQADLASLSARISSPILSAFSGGLQGAATGLSIASSARSLGGGSGEIPGSQYADNVNYQMKNTGGY